MGVFQTYVNLAQELGGIVADDMKRAVHPKPKTKDSPPRLLPREGDTRYEGTEIYHHLAWEPRQIQTGQSTWQPGTAPNPAYAAAKKAKQARQARSGRSGR